MHELSIALSIVEGVEAEAKARGIPRVVAVHLKLGPLSGVVKEALLFSYSLAAEGTIAEGSRLEVQDCPVLIFCPRCLREVPPVSWQQLTCSFCDTPAARVVSGTDLEVLALEVAADEPAPVG